MTLTQCFPLKNSGPSSTIKLKMALRVKNGPACISDLGLFILGEQNRCSRSADSDRTDCEKAVQ